MISNQAPPLRIRLLGGFRAERDGLPVLERWHRPGAQTLVKLLAVAPGHRMHREQVREICRPGAPRQAAMSSLRVALHTARHALQPELRPREESAYLLLEGELLALSRTLVTVDVDETEALALAALDGTDGFTDGGRRVAGLDAALKALREDLLPEDPYAEWLTARRTTLSLLRDRVLHALADTHLSEGSPEEAVALLEGSLSSHPADERAHESLMRAQLALRRPEQALRQYRLATEALETELGVRPGGRLEELRRRASAASCRTAATPSARPPLPAAIRLAVRTPLFGREQVLRAVTAEEAGIPPLTLVSGEAGIGKTRLAAEAALTAHRRGALVLWGASHEAEGQTPYGLWAEALDAWFADRSAEQQAAAVTEYPALAGLVPALGPAPTADFGPEEERARLFHAVGGLLASLACASRPGVLVVLDDLHAADLGSLQLLYHLIRRTGTRAWRFVATSREEDLAQDPARRRVLEAAVRQGLARRLDLMRLGERDCGRLVVGLCGGAAPAPDQVADIFRLSAGNPLFAGELARLLDSGLPSAAGVGAGPAGFPDSVRAAVDARLDHLDDAARALVDVLAAAGGDVSLREAAEVARSALYPPLGEAEFAAAADRVLAAGLVEEREVASAGRNTPGFAFRHPLVRLACYERLTAARRRVMHSAYGDAVLRHRPDAVDTLAFHFVQADDPRAVTWLRRAADRASALYANDSADGYYTELVARLGTAADDTTVADVRHGHGLVLRRMARYPEAEQALRSALDCRFRAGAFDAAARSLAALAEAVCSAGRPRDARALLDSSPVPGDSVSAAALALDRLASSVTDFHLGRYEQSLAAALEAEQAARAAGDDDRSLVPLLLGRATGNQALALTMLGQDTQARRAALESLDHAEQAGDMRLLTTVLSMLSNLALEAGKHEEARSFRTKSLDLAERGGDPTVIAFERGSLARLDLLAGDIEAAHAGAHAAVDLVRPFGPSWSLAYTLAYLAEVSVGRADWAAAETALRECAELADDSGDAHVREAVERIGDELASARAAVRRGRDEGGSPA
ncbi:ATP-binding protein [Streptomyces sp. NPDC057543]|uniref:ATP-binding protein n=1 Tax=Streptomyces sp. NPDC057543 TaxID=3346163 RepID=UPI0036A6B98C